MAEARNVEAVNTSNFMELAKGIKAFINIEKNGQTKIINLACHFCVQN